MLDHSSSLLGPRASRPLRTASCHDLARHPTSDILFILRSRRAGGTPAVPVRSLGGQAKVTMSIMERFLTV